MRFCHVCYYCDALRFCNIAGATTAAANDVATTELTSDAGIVLVTSVTSVAAVVTAV